MARTRIRLSPEDLPLITLALRFTAGDEGQVISLDDDERARMLELADGMDQGA